MHINTFYKRLLRTRLVYHRRYDLHRPNRTRLLKVLRGLEADDRQVPIFLFYFIFQ